MIETNQKNNNSAKELNIPNVIAEIEKDHKKNKGYRNYFSVTSAILTVIFGVPSILKMKFSPDIKVVIYTLGSISALLIFSWFRLLKHLDLLIHKYINFIRKSDKDNNSLVKEKIEQEALYVKSEFDRKNERISFLKVQRKLSGHVHDIFHNHRNLIHKLHIPTRSILSSSHDNKEKVKLAKKITAEFTELNNDFHTYLTRFLSDIKKFFDEHCNNINKWDNKKCYEDSDCKVALMTVNDYAKNNTENLKTTKNKKNQTAELLISAFKHDSDSVLERERFYIGIGGAFGHRKNNAYRDILDKKNNEFFFVNDNLEEINFASEFGGLSEFTACAVGPIKITEQVGGTRNSSVIGFLWIDNKVGGFTSDKLFTQKMISTFCDSIYHVLISYSVTCTEKK